ncbi:aldehyde dehydrogenase family protein [Leptolyngbya sp. 7M]|uniref:aldehyde dehydrogenase family protein n=1 Tax=Leptolyngbya sp. 7M TaxID=2812896 RepID=UPI001B8B0CD6|nr:aldehyde dehydrogenase family protein [Leptolyngbya sp. 7M]QYO68248.1 aldehyde dehydrogenase family protein [Leptolyngbya sp. 7M]
MEDTELAAQQEARDAVEASNRAYLTLATFAQDKIDSICSAMSTAALANAVRLGRLANEETGFGKAEDKAEKNRFAAEDVWSYFRGLRTVGVIKETPGIIEIASPRGVVAAIVPSTNPTSTAIFKILIAIKSRNSIVLSPHPSATRCIAETTRIMKDAGVAAGLPVDAIYCLQNPTIQGTEELMRHKKTAVILATGGIGLVRAAYSSGKPAFGVGPGNVPVYVEKSADIDKAAADILTGTCFDNGTICASEQSVVVESSIEDELREAFRSRGGHFLSSDEAKAVARVLVTENRTLNPGIVGKSAEYIANLAGIKVPSGTRCLIADCYGVGRDHPWSIEKLSPTLAFFVVDSMESAAARCNEILHFGGMGHTAGMHTRDRAAAIRYGEMMPASRVIINSPTTHGAIGFSTDLPPSMTLGCGSWGGNVTSDNISPIHLLDVKRVAFETKPIIKTTPAAIAPEQQVVPTFERPRALPAAKRVAIAAIVDEFLKRKAEEQPDKGARSLTEKESMPATESPVKTVIHELRPQSLTENGELRVPVAFVSESDVRDALDEGKKIYINSKTIITPSAKDLGEEKEVFSRV